MPSCAIVGAGPRIGTGVARAFAEAGHDIILISRNNATTDPIVSMVEEHRRTASQFSFDATDAAATAGGFRKIGDDLGLPDVVLYNPANMVMAPYSEVSSAEMEETWPIMLYAAMNVAAAVLPSFKERGSGTILFTGGGFGIDPSVTRAPHSIAKAALRNYAHGLYLELKDSGIHAGTVTVHRPIQAGDDMQKCAATFLAMHQEPAGAWSWERHYGQE